MKTEDTCGPRLLPLFKSDPVMVMVRLMADGNPGSQHPGESPG